MSSNDEQVGADALLSDRWERHTDALRRSLPICLEDGDPQQLSDALDALGRLTSWIATWQTLVDDPLLGAVDARLRSTHAALAAVGDVDAIHTTMLAAAQRVAFARLATSSLQRELVHRRHSAHVRARSLVDSSVLLDDLEMIDSTIEFRPDARKRAVRVLPPLAKAQWRNLLRRVEALGDPVIPEALPPVATATARCRDGALDLRAAVGKSARKYATAMNRLHDHLTALHHAVMTADFLDHRGRVGGPTSATNAGLLRGVTLTAVADGLEHWPAWWADASRKKLRIWW